MVFRRTPAPRPEQARAQPTLELSLSDRKRTRGALLSARGRSPMSSVGTSVDMMKAGLLPTARMPPLLADARTPIG